MSIDEWGLLIFEVGRDGLGMTKSCGTESWVGKRMLAEEWGIPLGDKVNASRWAIG